MATDMHQAADPDETSGLPAPETVVPALLALIDGTCPAAGTARPTSRRAEAIR